jgi:hypothetical protein
MRTTLLILVCVLAACGGETDASTALPAGAPVAVADSARLSLGEVMGDTIQEFDRVVTPFLLADGRLVVPLNGRSLIRVFAPDGTYQATLGRYGEGPGEFTTLTSAWGRGDTIEAFDFGLRRINRFHPDGSSQTVMLTGGGRTDLAIPGGLSDGWALLRIDAAGNGQRDQWSVQRFDHAGAHVGEVAKLKGFLRQESSGADVSGPTPLSPRPRYVVHDGMIYLAETFEPVIRVFGPDGVLAREIRWDPGTLPAPDVALRVVIDATLAGAPGDQAQSRRRELEGYPPPERVSAFWDFLVDEVGFVWVRPFDASKTYLATSGPRGSGAGGGDWLILSPDGAVVNTVALPDDFEPKQITRDAVVGIARDEMDVQHVHVYPLERR